MQYPKPIMSITELTTLGFSRETLKQYTRIKGFPGTKTPGGGKWIVDTEEFEKWRKQRMIK